MLKAIREAKINTSWINPNTIYEDAMTLFIENILTSMPNNQFLKDFMVCQKRVSHCGMFNSLSQTLLKITSPGVPDFYQGTEIWDFSLVDPDNRKPVDYALRREMLNKIEGRESELGPLKLAKELIINKETGMIKLYLIYKALNYRKAHRELFEIGEYVPLETMGEKANNICVFVRRIGNTRAIAVVPRFFTKLISRDDGLPLGKEIWKDTFIVIPFADIGAKYRNVFTGEIAIVASYKGATALFLSDILMNFPVALMEKIA
jgi:(1->4)-alpha-D-glucan 1-alpha-D-glucosylmutase